VGRAAPAARDGVCSDPSRGAHDDDLNRGDRAAPAVAAVAAAVAAAAAAATCSRLGGDAIAEAVTGADEDLLTLTWVDEAREWQSRVDEAHEWQSRAIKGNQGHSRTILALTCDGGAQAQAVAGEGTVLGRWGGR
jgi:hypothetical protein